MTATDRRRVTIVDVARAAGVSTATVSQVLSGQRPVAQETRDRVTEVIASLGYRPSALGRGLRTKHSNVIGVVLPDLANPFYPALVRGLQDRLYASGYHTMVCNTDGDPVHERELIADLLDYQVDGLIVTTFTLTGAQVADARAHGTPLVFIGPGEGVDHVYTDDCSGAAEMTRYLLDAGYASVGHLAGPVVPGAPSGPASRRLAGYTTAMGERGLPTEVVHTEFTLTGGAKAFGEMAERGSLPRALFCANDLIAIGALDAALDRGLRVPEDLAIAGFDDIEAASLVRPRLTTVSHPAGDLGSTAAELLLARIEHRTAGPAAVKVQLHIHRRGSA